MNDITLQEAAHKNVILWNIMRKLDFCRVKKTYDIRRKAVVMSFGRPTHGSYYWCNQCNFDRLKFLDDKGKAHIYEFTDMSSYIWQCSSEFNFYPALASKHLVFARAELLDHLIDNFKFGLKWKKEHLMTGIDEFAKLAIDMDLKFDDNDAYYTNFMNIYKLL